MNDGLAGIPHARGARSIAPILASFHEVAVVGRAIYVMTRA